MHEETWYRFDEVGSEREFEDYDEEDEDPEKKEDEEDEDELTDQITTDEEEQIL